MKKALAINCSPRKNRNTATILEKALEGAAEAGAETKLVHLHGLKFTGCISCLSCKRIENTPKICVVKDDLRPLLEECMAADALIVGSPIYFGNLNGFAINFLERLLFMNFTYNMEAPTKCSGKIAGALVCTMGTPEEQMRQQNYPALMERYTQFMSLMLRGPVECLAVTDTQQYGDKDFAQYMGSGDHERKAKVKAEQFPKDLEAARQLGARLVAA